MGGGWRGRAGLGARCWAVRLRRGDAAGAGEAADWQRPPCNQRAAPPRPPPAPPRRAAAGGEPAWPARTRPAAASPGQWQVRLPRTGLFRGGRASPPPSASAVETGWAATAEPPASATLPVGVFHNRRGAACGPGGVSLQGQWEEGGPGCCKAAFCHREAGEPRPGAGGEGWNSPSQGHAEGIWAGMWTPWAVGLPAAAAPRISARPSCSAPAAAGAYPALGLHPQPPGRTRRSPHGPATGRAQRPRGPGKGGFNKCTSERTGDLNDA